MGLTNERGIRRTILTLFFLSGACGLVYEVVWMRMLTLIFGATAFATSAILSSFFAGLALGSLTLGRAADRSRNPLALYAILEAGIGVFAFLMPVLLDGVTAAYVALAHHVEMGFYPMSLVRLVLSFLVLLLPTTLMGGTLPVVVKFLVQRRERIGMGVGRLYAVNTFGAVVGAFGAGFVLILSIGVRETAYLAGVINFLIAGVAFGLSRRVQAAQPGAAGAGHEGHGIDAAVEAESREPAASGEVAGIDAAASPRPDARSVGHGSGPDATGTAQNEPPWPGVLSPARARLALWAVGLSGLCALALEVLWTRALVYYLDNSTHAFTTMLTAFLLGIAIGSAIVTRFVDRRIPLLGAFGLVEVLIGLFALLAIPILARSTPVLSGMEEATLNSMFFWKWTALRFLRSLTVMLVPTILMGMTVPMVAKIYTRRLGRLGASLGTVYAMNTVGGVVGSLVAGFVLVPVLGVSDSIVLIAAFSAVIGSVLLLAESALAHRTVLRVAVAGGVVLVFGAGSWLARGRMVFASFRERADVAEVLSYREGIGSTVKVYRNKEGDKILSIDGFPVAGTSLGMLDAQESLGNLPLLLSPVPSPRVNLIGFGVGGASWEVLQYGVARVDCVELVPAVIKAAKWFPDVNHDVLNHPRYNLILGDGRNYALATDSTYDVISVDATSPQMAGNGSLYTLDFYKLVRNHLSADGLAVQWLPFHLLSDAQVRMTARTFMDVFPHTTLWFSPLRSLGLLVGTQEPLQVDYQAIKRKMQRPGVRQQLARVGVIEPLDVLAWFVMGETRLRNYVKDARLNTDDHPYLEFTPAWSYFLALRYATENLYNFGVGRESVFPLIVNAGDKQATAALRDSVRIRYEATQHSISGDLYSYLGQPEKAQAEYDKALAIDPGDRNAASPYWRARGLRR
ncbi:MAG: fused MFS/spermidine synthase [Gemmatimonadota bacterium]